MSSQSKLAKKAFNTKYKSKHPDASKHIVLMGEKVLIGSDPEVFVYDTKLKMHVPAAETGVTGTKNKPQELDNGAAVQIDGMALEFNTKPVDNLRDFRLGVKKAKENIQELIGKRYRMDFIPTCHFDPDMFKETPDEYKILGCDPDYDARTLQAKTPPEGSADKPFRTAGGHIHLGFTNISDAEDKKHIYDCSVIVQRLVGTLNATEKAYLHNKDNFDLINELEQRRRLYGSGQSFRPKKYGVEIRTPSNLWAGSSLLQRKYWERMTENMGYLNQHNTLITYLG